MNKIQDLSIRSAATWFWACSVACRILWDPIGMGLLGFFRLQFGLLTWKREFQSLTMRLHVNGYWKRSIIPTGILIGSYRILPRTLNCRNWFLSTQNVVQVRGCLLPVLWIQWVLSLWVSVKYILLCNSFVFSCIESIFCVEVLWDDRHQPHTSLLW